MFTGLVETTGRVARIERGANRALVAIDALALDAPLVIGESIAADGVCLTAARTVPAGFEADVSAETLAVTTLSEWQVGRTVNIERSLRLGERLGGHVVLGHVDGAGKVIAIDPDGDARRVALSAPEPLGRFIAAKGSIAIDGVSLTVNRVTGPRFEVMLVPHTLAVTALKDWRVGDKVNLEVDVLARYVAHLLDRAGEGDAALVDKLRQGGFMR